MPALPRLRGTLGKAWTPHALVIAVATIIAVTLTITRWMMAGGSILVSVNARGAVPIKHVDVLVDGKKVDCAGLPCAVARQSSGVHTVELRARGFVATSPKSIEVRPRGDAIVSFLIDALPSLGLRVDGAQPGVRLSVDGREIGELPQLVHGLGLGTHRILVAGGDAYQALERSVDLEPGVLTDLGIIQLKVLVGALTILPGPLAADRVLLHHGSEHRELGALPMTVSVVAEGECTIIASKRGYWDFIAHVNFADGMRQKTCRVNFERRAPADPLRPSRLGPDQIALTVARYTPSVERACWRAAVNTRAADAPASARVVVTTTVAPDGEVLTAATGSDPKGYPGLGDCVASRVRGWVFPRGEETTSFNLPFTFAGL